MPSRSTLGKYFIALLDTCGHVHAQLHHTKDKHTFQNLTVSINDQEGFKKQLCNRVQKILKLTKIMPQSSLSQGKK